MRERQRPSGQCGKGRGPARESLSVREAWAWGKREAYHPVASSADAQRASHTLMHRVQPALMHMPIFDGKYN
jgi:hypothetical protein